MEWELVCWPGKHKEDFHPLDRQHNRFQWTLEGELKCSLVFALNPAHASPSFDCNPEKPYFEMARYFKYEHDLSPSMIQESEYVYALRDIKNYGFYMHIFKVGASLEDFEEFFRQSLLPLPRGYMEAWEHLGGS